MPFQPRSRKSAVSRNALIRYEIRTSLDPARNGSDELWMDLVPSLRGVGPAGNRVGGFCEAGRLLFEERKQLRDMSCSYWEIFGQLRKELIHNEYEFDGHIFQLDADGNRLADAYDDADDIDFEEA